LSPQRGFNVGNLKPIPVNSVKLKTIAVVLCIMLAACSGAEGATGPEGAPGPQGPAGPSGAPGQTRLVLTGNLDAAGNATRTLPAAAGSNTNLPLFACYQLINNIWATEKLGGHSCALSNTAAPLNLAMVNGQALAAYMFVVVY
jgi:hypothetical protein